MRKLYFLVAMTIMSVFGFQAYAQDEYKATVTIDGQFYTFAAQDVDDNRNEAFAFTYNTYNEESAEFTFTSPETVYTLKGQNESNSFYVYINGIQVPNQAEEGQTGYVADVTFAAGDVVEIYENTPYVAKVLIDGQFYTFAAQDVDDNRNEAFAFTNDTYNNETAEFTFSPGITYALKGQNQNNTFYVYVNGVKVANQYGEGEQGYYAEVKFEAGDKVEIYEDTPYVAKALINGQFYTFVAQAGDDNRDEAFDFTYNTYDNESIGFTFNPGVTYTLKGYNESNTFAVYVNGIAIPNTAGEGETGYVAEVKFNIGDTVEIYENSPYVANVTINGQFYIFVAQAGDDNRDEAFDFPYATYDEESVEFTFSPGAVYTLKGQNQANTFAVFINGILIPNGAEEGQTGYVADVTFTAGDVVEIYEVNPYVASLTISGQFYTFVAQAGDDNRDEAFSITYGTYEEQTENFEFSPAATYSLKGQNESNSIKVYINGVEIANEYDADQQGYYAEVTFEAGDVVEIIGEEKTSGINDINVNVLGNGKVYNLQGIEMNNSVAPGIYISNGKKIIVR